MAHEAAVAARAADEASLISQVAFETTAARGLRSAVEQGIRGDALIATTALHHRHTLISADRRAGPVYSALGVDAIFIVTG